MFKPLSKFVLVAVTLSLSIGLNGCSNTTATLEKKPKTIQTLNNQHKVELGTVVAIRDVQIKPETDNYGRPYGNVGVSASSGGFRGIYGSIDLATIGRLFKNNTAKKAQEIIVKKNSGETVAITQDIKDSFKQGDAVKILVSNGYAQVIH